MIHAKKKAPMWRDLSHRILCLLWYVVLSSPPTLTATIIISINNGNRFAWFAGLSKLAAGYILQSPYTL